MTMSTRREYDNYTSIVVLGNDLGVRLRDPQTHQASYYKVPYQPHTFSSCLITEATENWRTVEGAPLRERRHESLNNYHSFTETAKREGRRVYGVISPVQQFIVEHVSPQCGMPFEHLRSVFLDIEVASGGGFAPPEDPTQPVLAITAEVWGTNYVWGTKPYTTDRADIHYTLCRDERDLLTAFVRWWTSDYPDIITGWNAHQYDVPYILNRIQRLNEEQSLPFTHKVLSPWRKLTGRISTFMGREQKVIDIVGVPVLDCLELYRKYGLTQRESYRLDAVAEVELGRKKVSFDEYGSLQELADTNYQKFIDYNITDVELVRAINNKLRHLDLCVQTAYGARVNFLDTYKQVRLWDSMIYYALHDQQIAVPPNVHQDEKVEIVGGYVKDPIVGKHGWVVSFDVNSLYPSIMRQWNISPDRHLPIEWLRNKVADVERVRGALRNCDPTPEECTPRPWIDEVREEDAAIVRWSLLRLIAYLDSADIDQALRDLTGLPDPFPWLRVLSVSMTPNRQVFRSDSDGFLPIMLAQLYEERKQAKKKETDAAKKATKSKTPEDRLRYEQDAIRWGLQQMTRKINLNSCYGAFGNEHFRFFDVRHAEAVTMTGQMIIRHVAEIVNRFLNTEFGTDRDYVVASDTDSIYVTLDVVARNIRDAEIVDHLDTYCERTLQPQIDRAFATIGRMFNTPAHILGMKRETIAQYAIWTAKKRYLLWVHDNEGVRFDPPKLKTVGIETIRSSTPKMARTILKQALEYLICGDKTAFHAILDDAEESYDTRPFEDIASPRTCNGMDNYPILANGDFTTKTPIQVKGALVYNRHLRATHLDTRYPLIRNGEKIRFCYLKSANPLRCNVIAAPNTLPPEWEMEQFLDRSVQFEKTILSPLEGIVKYTGWTIRPSTTLDF